MSGHSKWSTIKRAKAANDAKRGQLFTKLARELTVAARDGGSDPEMNVRLRLAVQKAKENNMPHDNIDRAIGRGSGEGGQDSLNEVVYEGYGPGGAAIMLEALTDNANRTVSEVRNAFAKGGGNLGERGCVAWNFDARGVVVVEASEDSAEDLTLLAIDAGADDFEEDEGSPGGARRPRLIRDGEKSLGRCRSGYSPRRAVDGAQGNAALGEQAGGTDPQTHGQVGRAR